MFFSWILNNSLNKKFLYSHAERNESENLMVLSLAVHDVFLSHIDSVWIETRIKGS